MEEEQQEKVTEFCSITGADTERADFFLQAAGWDMSVGFASLYHMNLVCLFVCLSSQW